MAWSEISNRLRLMWEEMAATGLEWPGENEEQPEDARALFLRFLIPIISRCSYALRRLAGRLQSTPKEG